MHRRDYALIARTIAETAKTDDEADRWTAAFAAALYSSPDNFSIVKFYDGVEQARHPIVVASSTEGRGASELLNTSTGEVEDLNESADRLITDKFDDAADPGWTVERVDDLLDARADGSQHPDNPHYFADENTPSDHFYRS